MSSPPMAPPELSILPVGISTQSMRSFGFGFDPSFQYPKRKTQVPRSDVRLSREEELDTEAKTREYFSGLTPLRHTKPCRSEYSSLYVDGNQSNEPIPELAEFQRLEKDSAKIVYDGGEIPEEFVETEYYGDLNCIDKERPRLELVLSKWKTQVGLGSTLVQIVAAIATDLARVTEQPTIGFLLQSMIGERLALESRRGARIDEDRESAGGHGEGDA